MGLLDSVSKGISGAVGGIASGLTGGVLSFMGQQDANAMSLAMAREQMDFQREMYQHRYQYTMDDMRAAGLNPIFAYQQGVGSSPQGASAMFGNTMQDALGAANSVVNNSIALKRNVEELKVMKAEAVKKDAERFYYDQAGIRQFEEKRQLLETRKVIQEAIRSARNSNEIQEALMPVVKEKAKFEKENPWLIKGKSLMELGGSLLGGGNSASQMWRNFGIGK